ncbi:MAG: hypothetical protein NC828_00195 [Candidatus Omnitrophica bacterium]|nr:hypothetical protein [Candidatus Omnitrophota bacterium]
MDKKIPEFPQKLPGTFWGITVFFNPYRYKNKLSNYRIFREANKKQGLNLLTVELAFGNAPFELSQNDSDILIQLRTETILWHRERLINIGLESLPCDCDKVVWLDNDIIFKNDNWINETSRLLERYVVIQPFSYIARLQKGVYDINPNRPPAWYDSSYNTPAIAYRYAENIATDCYVSGGTWANRIDLYKGIGLYDRLVVGGADFFMACAFYNKPLPEAFIYPDKLLASYERWKKEMFKRVQGSVYYTKGLIVHLWHGDMRNRLYRWRNTEILKKYDFDPDTDIKLDKNGCWVWASDKPQLHTAVKRYFYLRNEEDSWYKDLIYSIYVANTFPVVIRLYLGISSFIGRRVKDFFIRYFPKIYNRLRKIKRTLRFS